MYLCIDNTHNLFNPGSGFANAHLSWGREVEFWNMDGGELPAVAKWFAVHGGRDLLDAFELACINRGLLQIHPSDEACDLVGAQMDKARAVQIIRADDGLRIVWKPQLSCEDCWGTGESDEDPDDDDCPMCDGDGITYGKTFETDVDGGPVAQSH